MSELYDSATILKRQREGKERKRKIQINWVANDNVILSLSRISLFPIVTHR